MAAAWAFREWDAGHDLQGLYWIAVSVLSGAVSAEKTVKPSCFESQTQVLEETRVPKAFFNFLKAGGITHEFVQVLHESH